MMDKSYISYLISNGNSQPTNPTKIILDQTFSYNRPTKAIIIGLPYKDV
ncbi:MULTISPECIES: hypothetical protein [Okeania]|nr:MULTISPECIES: hypothetical protein [Okeania]NET79986.1 hypothetical protein [Okeania sp. SIO1F9]NET93255.1 hypothetical protein [Okeania sp. SIO1H2]